MNSKFTAVTLAVAIAGLLGATAADAKRVGGGKSLGKQSNTVQREAAPTAPGTPAGQPGAAQAPAVAPRPAAAPAAAAAAAPARSRWMAPLAGLAAGLGLAWLAHSLGFGEGLANMLTLLLLGLAAFMLIRFFLSRRKAAAGPQPAYGAAYAAGSAGGSMLGGEASVPQRETYAQQMQREALQRESLKAAPVAAVGGAAAASAVAGAGTPFGIPEGFDVAGFVRNAKVMFTRLQASFDAADLNDLREFTTPEMYAELKIDIDERGAQRNVTEVVTLNAELLGIESDAIEHTASVRFSGLLREADDAAPASVDEVWNLTKPVAGQGGWVLAGIQQLS